MYKDKYELTIDKLLIASVRNNPKQEIAYRDETKITYSEFRERVYAMARGLVSLGLKKGDRVAMLDVDSLNYLIAYFAVPISGGVLHTVNIRYSPELIFYTMQHANDRFVIIRDEFVPLVEKSIGLFGFVEKWIVCSDSGKTVPKIPDSITLESVLNNGGKYILPELKEDDLATTFYTSGTTGLPKGVMFTHRKIVLHVLSSMATLAYEPTRWKTTDVVMPLVPMFHVHAWGAPYAALMSGMKYVLPGRYDFNKIPQIMANEGVTVSLMVPSVLYMLMTTPGSSDVLRRLKLRVTVGGGALPRGLAKKAEEAGIEVVGGYGMSETAPILTIGTFNRQAMEMGHDEQFEHRLMAGIPLALVDLKVVDSDFKEIPWDSKTIGEIVVRSPWLTAEYVNDPEATKKLWKNDWLHTGDLAVVDTAGYISIVDREKDAVKSGGEFIPTIVIEDVLSSFPGVGEVAVVARKDEKWGERPVAFLTGLEKIDKKAIEAHMMKYVESGRIAKFWIPDEYIVVNAFEKTSTGKIDKKPLKKRLEK
jgi:fatty-acyl-CoA synthase